MFLRLSSHLGTHFPIDTGMRISLEKCTDGEHAKSAWYGQIWRFDELFQNRYFPFPLPFLLHIFKFVLKKEYLCAK